ncbi:sensor histidine kinase [Melioribacteraceae bacterium 4301-Me]|uniref:sensor histidine kinase n=1 Tax=Pyranulibacter aquaticus TaxID=3163344 RepID=UPI003597F80E
MTNPFISNKKILSSYILIWSFIIVVQFAVLSLIADAGLLNALIDSLVFNIIFFLLGISLWYTASFNSLENYSILKITSNHLVAAVITSCIWVLLGYFLLQNLLIGNSSYLSFVYSTLIWRFLIGVLFYIIIVSVDYIIIYYYNFQEKRLKEAELKSLVKEAELKSLKYQINPHFIFNSLNSISSLTISNPKKAQEMTIKLSSFLRNTLSKNEHQKSKLTDEISNAKLYLDIEKVRFEEKFEFIEKISESCLKLEVPSMILQPLLENAIKHGVYECLDKVTIVLSCKEEKGYMKITVENNFDPEAVPKKGEGIGIKNIRNRLKLIYNQDNLISTEKVGNIFKANIYIPLN